MQTLLSIVNKDAWARWVPYLITYAVEWPLLVYMIKVPRLWLYLIVLGFDALMSLTAADPMMISDSAVRNTGYYVLYFNMIYILMSVMYFPTLLSLVIFSLSRTLFFTAYLIAVLFSCSFHESEARFSGLADAHS